MTDSSYYKKSLTRGSLIKISIGISVAVFFITLVTYIYVSSSLKTRALEDLEEYIIQRGVRESIPFTLAMDNQSAFAADLINRLEHQEIADANNRLDELFYQNSDGTLRIDSRFFEKDGITGVISTLGSNYVNDSDGRTEFPPSFKRSVIVGYDMLAQYGPAWHNRFVNLYISFPGNGIFMYWPDIPWGLKAGLWEINSKINLSNQNGEDVVVIDEASKVDAEPSWSNLYYDFAADNWMVSSTTPIILDGKHILSVSNDILLHELFERTITQHLEGTYNLIFDASGKLIVHPEFMDAIQSQGGDFSILEADNPNLRNIYELTIDNREGVIENVLNDEYLGITRLDGPDWYFVTVFPKSIISQGAFKTARFILIIGLVSLLLEISILYFFLKRQVATPLKQLMDATNRIASGDFSVELDVERRDEVGHLAHQFNTMAREIDAREKALKKARRELREMNESLEASVQLRTQELQKALKEVEHTQETLKQYAESLKTAMTEAESANKAKSEFLANMSHELRTPLNAILGFSSLMSRDPSLSESLRRNNEIISRSGHHLLSLINDVLDMAKIEAGQVELENAPFDLGAMVREVNDMMQLRAQDKGLKLQFDQTSLFPRYIVGDEARLRQILVNLVGNALKFTDQGGVTIRLGTRENSRTHLLIEVEDSGIGIAPEDQQCIFEPFLQLGEEAVSKGSGLGLSITRQMVQLMGGHITLESALGKGSVFKVDLPLQKAQESDFPKPKQAEAGEVAHLAPGQPEYRILIVEDQLDNQMLLAKLLESVGFQTKVAANGEEGIRLFQSWHPHFIWMDRRMPVMDGMEATRRIRELPGGRDVKIVAVTASAFTEERNQLLAGGMDDYVRKPYQAAEIYDCLSKYLGVKYIYESASESQVQRPPLTPEMVEGLPEALRDDLIEALESLEIERINSAIQQVSTYDQALRVTLGHLASNFDYVTIMRALKAKGDTSPT